MEYNRCMASLENWPSKEISLTEDPFFSQNRKLEGKSRFMKDFLALSKKLSQRINEKGFSGSYHYFSGHSPSVQKRSFHQLQHVDEYTDLGLQPPPR